MALERARDLSVHLNRLEAASSLLLTDAAERPGVSIRRVDGQHVGIPLTSLSFGVLSTCLAVGLEPRTRSSSTRTYGLPK